jgi:hypothetical protein
MPALLYNILVLTGTGVVALIITFLFWNPEKTRERWRGDFRKWWNSDGIMIWIFAGALLIIIIASKGCFHL